MCRVPFACVEPNEADDVKEIFGVFEQKFGIHIFKGMGNSAAACGSNRFDR